MRAAIRRTYGLEDQISVEETTVPTPKAKEILIKVHTTTVNRTDCAILSGKPFIFRLFTGIPKPKSPVLGSDFAGEVVALGSDVTEYTIGDRVFGFNDEGHPTQAEYVTIHENRGVYPIPDTCSYSDAAASAEGAHYAYNFLTKVHFQKGDRVFVNGGTGAIGSALIQFLVYHGCIVTATARAEHFDMVHALGAHKVIDYNTEDFTDCGEEFSIVFDAVGKSSFKRCKKILTPKGVYISSELGEKSENPFLAIYTPLFGGKKVAFPFPVNVPRSLAFVSKLLTEGCFTPLIDREFSLHDVQEAYRYVCSGTKIGNVILRIT